MDGKAGQRIALCHQLIEAACDALYSSPKHEIPETMNSAAQTQYRADIDGLRAVAILSVIGFHAMPGVVTGGFAGVDIFFVISGYLIFGIIYQGTLENSFSYRTFYSRRIKRLLPAFILVSLFTLVVSSWLYIPNDYLYYTTSLAASWAAAANVFFSQLSGGYFEPRVETFPLLHVWSLSVEEQFYLLFPLVFIGLVRGARLSAGILGILFIALFFLLLYVSEHWTSDPGAYYGLASRAHELLLGAIVTLLPTRILRTKGIPVLLASVGLLLTLGSVFVLSSATPFPGTHSLFPILGSGLLLYSGQSRNPIANSLSSPPLVYVGSISYALYLWHWPIFAFIKYRAIESPAAVTIIAIALAFVLADLTTRYVERPVRALKLDFKTSLVGLYGIPAVLFTSLGLFSYETNGIPSRFPADIRELVSSYSSQRSLSRKCSAAPEGGGQMDIATLSGNCSFGSLSQPDPQILLIGDSHANHFKDFMAVLAANANLRGVYFVQGSCSPIDLPAAESLNGGASASTASTCQKQNAELYALASRFEYFAIAGFWQDVARNRDAFETRLGYALAQIQRAGSKPIVFKDNATSPSDLSQCVLHQRRGWMVRETNCNIPAGYVRQTQGDTDHIIDKVAAKYDAIIIDPKLVMCDGSQCTTYLGNTAYYRDSHHLNAKASQFLGHQFLDRFGNPIAQATRPLKVP